MCDSSHPGSHLPRRKFLGVLGAGMAAAALGGRSLAAAAAELSKPQNAISADDALDQLLEGNDRYVRGNMRPHDFATERDALTRGQAPFAGILSCSDSRIGPEFAFDVTRGNLFAVRIAGNFLSDDGLASLEYTTAVLGTPLLLVLGHDSCGAVDAAIKVVNDDAKLPGHLPGLVKQLKPAVRAAKDEPGNLLENAIKANVALTVERLKKAGPVIAPLVESGKVRVVGGIYRLATGRVEILDA